MKILHLSDLHLGKRLHEFSMIEDQKFILQEILNIIDNHATSTSSPIDAVVIAGDVYDKSIPSTESVELFDTFLVSLSKRNLKVFVISGNHDSPERIAFGGRLMNNAGVHMSPAFKLPITPITLEDSHGCINIYMLPFIKPAHVRTQLHTHKLHQKIQDLSQDLNNPQETLKEQDIQINTYTDAVKFVIDSMNIDKFKRNILITHQFVTGAERSDSEEISVGGSDNVDATVFSDFDYVALGHIHRPQNIADGNIRYCGTPIKYSFSECNHEKSITIVELLEKDNLSITTETLSPARDLKEIKGRYDDISVKEFYENQNTQNYMHITLTDEQDIPDALGKLRKIYPNIMQLDYDNTRTRALSSAAIPEKTESKPPIEVFSSLYQMQNNAELTSEQEAFLQNIIDEIWEERV